MADRIENLLEVEQRRAKKVEALVALLRDPELADFVTKLFGGAFGRAGAETTSTNGHHPLPTAIRHAIRAIAGELPRPCIGRDIIHQLKARNFVFNRNPEDAVRDAMYVLARGEGRIFRIVEEGKGGKPSKYQLLS
jgi:hypothetical protein